MLLIAYKGHSKEDLIAVAIIFSIKIERALWAVTLRKIVAALELVKLQP